MAARINPKYMRKNADGTWTALYTDDEATADTEAELYLMGPRQYVKVKKEIIGANPFKKRMREDDKDAEENPGYEYKEEAPQ